MDSVQEHLDVTVTHIDAGGTIQTIIMVGDHVVASYLPGTRHMDKAQECAREVIADALRPLFRAAIETNPYAREIHPDYSDVLASEYDTYLDDTV